MRVVQADGTGNVATLLRALADQVEETFPSIRAVVQFPEETDTDTTALEVRLLHSSPRRWNLTELESALSHPGD